MYLKIHNFKLVKNGITIFMRMNHFGELCLLGRIVFIWMVERVDYVYLFGKVMPSRTIGRW